MRKIKIIVIVIVALMVASVGGFYSGQIAFVPQAYTTTEISTKIFQLTETQTATITTTISVRETTEILVKRSVEAQVDDEIIHYREELFWSRDYFSEITTNKAEFSFILIERFEEGLSKQGEGEERAIRADVKFDETHGSTTLTCEVHGAISRRDGSYHATFFWLLRPLGLDFIDDRFEHPERSLRWDGRVEGVYTEVVVKLPVSVPEWGSPNGHCHAHVWWEEK